MSESIARVRLDREKAPKRALRADQQTSRQERRGGKLLPGPTAPILKWAGGKSRLIGELSERTPERYRRYFEPFVGGGALFFRTAPESAVLNDRNPDLINAYRCVAWNVESVIRRLVELRRRHSEERYYEVRDRFNDRSRPMTDVARAAAFIYLNKTCYNGLWRVNSKGAFNVPVGRYKDPQIFDRAQLRAASRLLQRTELRAGDYAACVESARAGDFVYFDPPYAPVSATANFTAYTAGDFGADDQQALADLACYLQRQGVHVLISNSDSPVIRELYQGLGGFVVEEVECSRAINSKAAKRGAVTELLISGVPS
jgi:DNA adenine methylase